MRVVLATVGSAGDVAPIVAIGTVLAGRGHRVSVLTNPHFRAMVEDAGLELAPIGTAAAYDRALADPDLWHPTRGLRTIARAAILPAVRPMYDYLAGLDAARTVLAATALAFGPRLAQERLGFRLVTLHLQPAPLLSAYDNPEMAGVRLPGWLPVRAQAWRLELGERRVVDPLLTPGLGAVRAELGLAPVSRVLGRWIHSPDRAVGLFPDWFAPPRPDWPANLVLTGFPGGADGPLDPGLAAFLAAGEPPVVITVGSAMAHAPGVLGEAVAAVRRAGRRAVVLTQFRDQLPPRLPPEVRHVAWAPLGRLLPHAAALIHHAGVGTAAQALAAGVPQLVVPFAHDQPDNANRLCRLGVAERVSPRRFRAPRAAAALRRLLDPAVAARCAGYADRVDFRLAAARAGDVIEATAPSQG
ncbi:glycosyltransferase [Georgenia ruanii]|uniref:glycosyltransferase n=1 Tax=Georgenia ruanii TaxID=348442 RepID=UPI00126576ED|nr:glycosyltransferase [Georgenia ruanii]